ncbi:MAG: hypothetical protein ABL917_02895 [Parcubacteria group bacterium]
MLGEVCGNECYEEDGIIYFWVKRDGPSGQDWITRLNEGGVRTDPLASQVLLSSNFNPKSGIWTKVAIVRGDHFSDEDRVTGKIFADMDRRGWSKADVELACLVREKVTDMEMRRLGLVWIPVMHDPVEEPTHGTVLLTLYAGCDSSFLGAYEGRLDYKWGGKYGFACVVSEVSSQP